MKEYTRARGVASRARRMVRAAWLAVKVRALFCDEFDIDRRRSNLSWKHRARRGGGICLFSQGVVWTTIERNTLR
jgi:hypothetical protein